MYKTINNIYKNARFWREQITSSNSLYWPSVSRDMLAKCNQAIYEQLARLN